MTGASSKSLTLGLGVGLWSGPSGKFGSFFLFRQRNKNQPRRIRTARKTIPTAMPAFAAVGKPEDGPCDSEDKFVVEVVSSAKVVVAAALLMIVTVAGGTGTGAAEDIGLVGTVGVDDDVDSTDALFTDVVFEGVSSSAPHMYGPQTSGYPTASQYPATDF
ncbi:hypothetical protein EYR41_007701 [Orbilia oligospora]|uniref:Uncharacterized protein n=1 Tax=Orbilia oligospora TaxID=2813651 RepID=A0A8H2DTJ6_ORBOL|nr:hypothetical protein EYR41_007701 [Orbilia oligospora]